MSRDENELDIMFKKLNDITAQLQAAQQRNGASSRPISHQSFTSNSFRPPPPTMSMSGKVSGHYRYQNRPFSHNNMHAYTLPAPLRPRSGFTYCRNNMQLHNPSTSIISRASVSSHLNKSVYSSTKSSLSSGFTLNHLNKKSPDIDTKVFSANQNIPNSSIKKQNIVPENTVIKTDKLGKTSVPMSSVLNHNKDSVPTITSTSQNLDPFVQNDSKVIAVPRSTSQSQPSSITSSKDNQAFITSSNEVPAHVKNTNTHSRRILNTAYKVVNNKAQNCEKKMNSSAEILSSMNREISSQTSANVPISATDRIKSPKNVIAKTPSMKNVMRTKYKIVNQKKSGSKSFHKTPPNKKEGFITRKSNGRKIVNSPVSLSSTPEKNSKFANVSVKTAPSEASFILKYQSRKSDIDQRVVPPTSGHLRTFNFEGNKNCNNFDLTDLEPEDILLMDHSSMLKLSELVSSSKQKKPTKISSYKFENKLMKSTKFHLSRGKHTSVNAKFFSFSRNHSQKKRLQQRTTFQKLDKRPDRPALVSIGDINYRVSRMKISKATPRKTSPKAKSEDQSATVIIFRGVRFSMDPTGTTLTRLSTDQTEKISPLPRICLGGRIYVKKTADVYVEVSNGANIMRANKVLNRIKYQPGEMKKGASKTTYCMFYNRYGKCNNCDRCPFVHDPSKIAVCTRFLKGTCKVEKCSFSHERNPGKMAICTYFLQGSCTVSDCPYRHESLQPDAELCQDFVKGYCPSADKCKKAHILVCPKYFQGNCPKGKTCPYPHPMHKTKKTEQEVTSSSEEKTETSKNPSPAECLPTASEEDEEMRYYSITHPISTAPEENKDAQQEGVEKNQLKEICMWSNEGTVVQVLPGYIPLSFKDSDCLM